MVEYKCFDCNKIFNKKSNYMAHINKKNKCSEKYDNIIEKNLINNNTDKAIKIFDNSLDELKCIYCEKKFSTKSNVVKHIRTKKCVKLQENSVNIKDEINEIKKKYANLEKIILELSKNKDNSNGNNNIINNNINNKNKIIENNINNLNQQNNINLNQQNNINQNIVLVEYGHENLDNLTKDDYLRVLKKGYSSIVELTKLIHFNPKFPENNNIYIPSTNKKFAKKYDGKEWINVIKKDLVNDIYYDKKGIVSEKFEELNDELTGFKKSVLTDFLNMDENNRKDKDSKNKIKGIKNQIELLLNYEKKQIIKQKIEKTPE
jgi:hypothetical protein